MELKVHDVSSTINDKQILHQINLHISRGEFVGLLGPNGSGKSTLLRNIYRSLVPISGWITLQGQDVHKMRTKKLAQHMAVVRQESSLSFDFTVREIVAMGRYPHRKSWETMNQSDESLIRRVLDQVGIDKFIDRSFHTLSGGEKQRVLIARALAQQAKLIVLDEPTNHLDIQSQLQILDILKRLQCSVLTALHDLNIAAHYCDHIYVMKEGHIVAFGPPEKVLQKKLIHDVFQVDCEVIIHPLTKKPNITYLGALP